MIPQAVVLMEVRDAEKLGRVLEVVKQYAAMGGAEMRSLRRIAEFTLALPATPVRLEQ